MNMSAVSFYPVFLFSDITGSWFSI